MQGTLFTNSYFYMFNTMLLFFSSPVVKTVVYMTSMITIVLALPTLTYLDACSQVLVDSQTGQSLSMEFKEDVVVRNLQKTSLHLM